MKIYKAFYVDNSKPLNALISIYTWLPNIGTPNTSHEEIILPVNGEYLSFSSTNREGAKGTRWEDPKKTFRNPGKWVFLEKEVSDIEALSMVKNANSILGLKYDWFGISGS